MVCPRVCHLARRVRLPSLRVLAVADKMNQAETHAEMREQSSSAVSLAIARYAREHPEALEAAEAWGDPAIAKFLKLSVAEISAEASRRLDQLERWEQRAKQDFPDVWEQDRVNVVQTELSLRSAKTGHFGTAMGGLHDFLRDVGAPAQELDIH